MSSSPRPPNSARDSLETVLREESIKRALFHRLQDVYQRICLIATKPGLIDPWHTDLIEADLETAAPLSALEYAQRVTNSSEFYICRTRVVEIIHKHVIERLRPPAMITAEEITHAARCLLVIPAEFEAAYERFVCAVLSCCESSYGNPPAHTDVTLCDTSLSVPFEVSVNHVTLYPDFYWPDDLPVVAFRRPGLAVSVHVRETLSPLAHTLRASNEIGTKQIFARVEASEWSKAAFDAFLQEAVRVLPACFRCLEIAGHFDCRVCGRLVASENDLPGRIEIRRYKSPNGEECVDEVVPFPDQIDSGLSHYAYLLNLYWLPPESHDSLKRRIRNALRLYVEAQAVSHPSVKVAVLTAALEAVLSRNKDGISKELSESAATLLQHDRFERQSATKGVQELYNARSRILHGEAVDGHEDVVNKVDVLVAGVIKGILDWAVYMRKMGCEKEGLDKEFWKNLASARSSGTAMVGVPPRLRRCLPNHDAADFNWLMPQK